MPGFVSYTAFRDHDGGTAVTACEDKQGTDESTKVAAKWVLESSSMTPPVSEIEQGNSLPHFPGG